MNVLHLPTSIGGNSWGLARGERSLGLHSSVLYTESNYISYPSHINLHTEDCRNSFTKFFKLMKTFINIRNKYDIFHFNFGKSLFCYPSYKLYHSDLPFYPKSSKLFVTYNGCDARQKFPTIRRRDIAPCHDDQCFSGQCNSGKLDEIRCKLIKKMSKYVKHMWALNPDLLHFLPPEKSSFLPYTIAQNNAPILRPDFSKKKMTIIHAPTNRAFKGSKYIIDAIDSLRKSHSEFFEFITIENTSHKKAIKLYQQADIVIDQLLAGWYGAFAIEAMSMGKPVICWIDSEDLHLLPKNMAHDVKDAFIRANPKNIKEVILRCIDDHKYLKQKSEAGFEYARTWHDPKYVADLTKQAYET